MQNEEKAKVLSADNSPYDFNGNSGISHRIRLNIAGEVYAVKTSETQVNEFQKYVGKDVKVVLEFTSPKENLKMSILSVSEVKE